MNPNDDGLNLSEHGAVMLQNVVPHGLAGTLTMIHDRALDCIGATTFFAGRKTLDITNLFSEPDLLAQVGQTQRAIGALALAAAGIVDARPTRYGGVFVSDPARQDGQDFHWHCDGHFDGLENEGVTVWVPLCDCGDDAPGIALAATCNPEKRFCDLPQMIDRHPGVFTPVDWPSVTDEQIARLLGPIHTPRFHLCDALVFTNRCLHRTDVGKYATRARSALIMRFECAALTPSPRLECRTAQPLARQNPPQMCS